MKKVILLLSILTITSISMISCKKVESEKKPVVIEDATVLEEDANLEISKDESEVEETTDTPESMTIQVEGLEETINGLRHKGDGYEIIYDVDSFKHTKVEESDTFIANNSDSTIYPDVYLTISRLENQNIFDFVEELSDTLSKKDLEPEITTDATIGNYNGTIITVKEGSDWNSIIRNYYIIDNGTSLYTLESQYFLEAEEGYGARILAMLNTFEMK